MKSITTTYILNLPHPCLKTVMPGGTISHIAVCSKIQTQNQTQNQQNKMKQQQQQQKKKINKRRLDIFCKRSIARCRASGGGKKERKKEKKGEYFLQ